MERLAIAYWIFRAEPMAAGIFLRSALIDSSVAAADGLQRQTIFAPAQSNNSIRNVGGWESDAARESVGRLQRNRNEVVNPAGGPLVVGDDQLERSGFAEGLAVASVGHEYFASVKTGIGFGVFQLFEMTSRRAANSHLC
jgi:hypothetical protein